MDTEIPQHGGSSGKDNYGSKSSMFEGGVQEVRADNRNEKWQWVILTDSIKLKMCPFTRCLFQKEGKNGSELLVAQ